jgi:hypothetical protein
VVAYGFQSSSQCPKGHYLGRCTVLFRPVCLSSTCLSITFLSIWLASQSDCLRFFSPPYPPTFVDSLDSELWYRSGCRAAALASSSTSAVGAVFSAAFHHAERAPRVTSSLTVESPIIRSSKNILSIDIGILVTRVLRARKARKSAGGDG